MSSLLFREPTTHFNEEYILTRDKTGNLTKGGNPGHPNRVWTSTEFGRFWTKRTTYCNLKKLRKWQSTVNSYRHLTWIQSSTEAAGTLYPTSDTMSCQMGNAARPKGKPKAFIWCLRIAIWETQIWAGTENVFWSGEKRRELLKAKWGFLVEPPKSSRIMIDAEKLKLFLSLHD